MWRIALKMLLGDTAKFCGILLGITFASLLIMQQGSIFCGLMKRTGSQINEISGVDLWVMDPNVRHIDDVKAMMESNLYRVRGVEGVFWAVPLYKGTGRAKLTTTDELGDPLTIIESVILLGLDDTTLVGAPAPDMLIAGALLDLRMPDAIIIDKMQLPKYYPGEPWEDLEREGNRFYDRFLGREMEMNDHRARIVGICKAAPTFGSNAVVYTTYSRAKQFVAQERKVLSFILVRADPSWKIADVARNIRAKTGLGAMSADDFARQTILFFLMNTGIVINFGITSLLGLFVGTAIAGQTFYLFTVDNLKQFGALKAMGASNPRIVAMILLQAAVVGLIGFGLGVGISTFVADRVSSGGGRDRVIRLVAPAAAHRGGGGLYLFLLQPALHPPGHGAGARDRLPGLIVGLGRGPPQFSSRARTRAMIEVIGAGSRPGVRDRRGGVADVAVRVRGLSKHFGAGSQRVAALRSIDWDVEAGEMSMIVGPSGCGKTILLSVIAGVLDGDEGRVTVFGREISGMGGRAKTNFRARHIGFVFQQYNLLPALTAAENVATPLVLAGWSWKKAVGRGREVLEMLGMGNRAESFPRQLSGGQQQRVAISRALAHEPALLVCDEPTAALDHETGRTVMELLRSVVVRPDRAVIVVTHDNRIFHYGEKIIRMDDGRIVDEERPRISTA